MPLHSNLGYSTPYSVFNTISREEKLKRILKEMKEKKKKKEETMKLMRMMRTTTNYDTPVTICRNPGK